MPTFLARRYMRTLEQVGPVEKAIGVVILLILIGGVALFVTQVSTDSQRLFEVDESAYGTAGATAVASRAPTASPFPDPELPGWGRPADVRHFTPADLHLKINGRADAYLALGVASLTFATFVHADGAPSVDVYWYDMSTPANAAAMYRLEAAPTADSLAVGDEGYIIGGAVFFRRGSNYVQVMPNSPDTAGADAAWAIATAMAQRMDQP